MTRILLFLAPIVLGLAGKTLIGKPRDLCGLVDGGPPEGGFAAIEEWLQQGLLGLRAPLCLQSARARRTVPAGFPALEECAGQAFWRSPSQDAAPRLEKPQRVALPACDDRHIPLA
jgi:hypothetical protein